MTISFHTKSINEKFYKRFIEVMVYHHLKEWNYYDFMVQWDITLYDLNDANQSFYDHVKLQEGRKINPLLPSGVTGKNQVNCYLHDSKNDFKTRENLEVIQHELCHAILIHTNLQKKRPGKKQNLSTELVHERANSKRWFMNFWHYSKFWKKWNISIIEIRDYLK